jgi:hypothetical protein
MGRKSCISNFPRGSDVLSVTLDKHTYSMGETYAYLRRRESISTDALPADLPALPSAGL